MQSHARGALRVFAFGLAAILCSFASIHAQTLTIDAEEFWVMVSGASPYARIALFSVSHEQSELGRTVATRDVQASSDGSGTARLTLATKIASFSVWIAIDRQTGRYGVHVPGNSPAVQIAAPADVVQTSGQRLLLNLPFGYAEAFVVRPGGGAWIESATKGGIKDLAAASASSALLLSTDDFQSIDGASAARSGDLKVGDVIVAVNRETLTFFVYVVTGVAA